MQTRAYPAEALARRRLESSGQSEEGSELAV